MGRKKGSIVQYLTDDANLAESGKAAKGKAKASSSKRKQADEETLQSEEQPDESPKKTEIEEHEEEGDEKTGKSENGETAAPPKKVKGNREKTAQSEQLVQVPQAKKVKVKDEKPEPEAQRRMVAKLHYLAKTGKPEALAEYKSKDVEGKRAWFHEVYKLDPNLPKYSNVIRTKTHYRSDFSYSS